MLETVPGSWVRLYLGYWQSIRAICRQTTRIWSLFSKFSAWAVWEATFRSVLEAGPYGQGSFSFRFGGGAVRARHSFLLLNNPDQSPLTIWMKSLLPTGSTVTKRSRQGESIEDMADFLDFPVMKKHFNDIKAYFDLGAPQKPKIIHGAAGK